MLLVKKAADIIPIHPLEKNLDCIFGIRRKVVADSHSATRPEWKILGHSILIAESNIHHVPESTARLYVIERGEIVFAGRPADVHRDPTVVRIIGGTTS